MTRKKRICFFVISVIQPHTSEPFTYGCRSTFSSEERRSHTMKTIQSIKRYFPQADIIFVEGGMKFDAEINSLVKKYLHIGRYSLCKRAVSNISKAWGELVLTILTMYTWLKYDYTFKLSGRYWLNGSVDYQMFTKDTKRVTGLDIYGDCSQISTRLIGIPRSCYFRYMWALVRRFWRVPNSNTVFEAYIFKGLSLGKINFIPKIGVTGFTGVTNELIEE